MMTRLLRKIGLWPEAPPTETPETRDREVRATETRVRLDRLLEAVDAELRSYPGYIGLERRTGHPRRRDDV